MENYLLEGEELLQHSPNNVVVLTTHRIRYHAVNSSHAHLVSVMLEKVSSCEVRYQSSPLLLILGVTFGVLGGISLLQSMFGGGEIGAAGLLLGVILLLCYVITRKHIVSIASDGGARIGFETSGMKKESVVSLINNLEKAKHERVTTLARSANAVYA
ncbi:hypothetical protein [Hymenobacter sp. UYCo722]|uniref:hypothetical protein n=1 Tax=Hymenobacter sp. UYCo722 TaxID=3156335 RepID=UPI003396255B